MSSAAVDASPISYGLVELSEEDQIKQQKELIKQLDEPDMLEKFIEECKKSGQRALAIEYDFIRVKAGLAELIRKYGKDFPTIESEYDPRWGAFIAVSQHFSFLSPLNDSGAL